MSFLVALSSLAQRDCHGLFLWLASLCHFSSNIFGNYLIGTSGFQRHLITMSGRRKIEGTTFKFIPCGQCGTSVHVPKNRWNKFRFCSRKCGWAWHNEHDQVSVICKLCGCEFKVIACRKKTAKYCSRRCYYKSLNGKGSVEHICRCCGKRFMDSPSHNRIYCSKTCVNKTALTRFNPKTAGTALTAMRRRGMVKSCSRCGYSKNLAILGIHHKDRNRQNNRLSNLEVLCPNCHSIEHSKHLVHSGSHG